MHHLRIHHALVIFTTMMLAGCSTPPAAEPATRVAGSYVITDAESGHQLTVHRITDTFFTGNCGVYDAVNLQRYPETGGWVITVYLLSNPSSELYPSVGLHQAEPDADNPQGHYTQHIGEAEPIGLRFTVETKANLRSQ